MKDKKTYSEHVKELALFFDDMENANEWQLAKIVVQLKLQAIQDWISYKDSLAGPIENQDRITQYFIDNGLLSPCVVHGHDIVPMPETGECCRVCGESAPIIVKAKE